MGIMVLALGFAVLFNFIILRVKWNKGMYADVGVDIFMLVLLNSVFGGSILGVVSATAGSTLISLYLMWQPVKLMPAPVPGDPDEPISETEEALQRMRDRLDELFEKQSRKTI